MTPAGHDRHPTGAGGQASHRSGLDPVVHERLRLALLVALAAKGPMTFSEARSDLGMTDGNLGIHARRLEEVGYVEVRKTAEGRASRTVFHLTPAGRRALDRYLAQMQALIDEARRHLPAR